MATTTIDHEAEDGAVCRVWATPLDFDPCVQPACERSAVWDVDGRELCTLHAARRIRRTLRFGGAR